MATNPRIPEHRDVPTLVEQKHKKSSAPLVLFGIFAAAIILAAILIWMPRAPRPSNAPSNAVVPSQPGAIGSQVQLSEIRLSPASAGSQMYIYARLSNTGNTAINALTVNVAFPSAGDGRPAGAVTAEAESYDNGQSQSLASAPIKPNQTRDVRIPIEGVPAGWNHQTPEIKVQDVGAYQSK
jgi:hypothetical protein